jgi:hypothetical protein
MKATVQDIIRQDVERTGGDFNRTYAALQQEIGSNKMRVMRSGNTLLIYTIKAPGQAEIHIATMDSPREVVDNVKKLYQAMLKSGFKKATSTVTNPTMTKVLDQAGIQYRVQQKPSVSGEQEFAIEIGA